MRFEQSLTAFALESSGAAARALGISHTMTLAAPLDDEPALEAAAGEAPLRAAVGCEPPPGLTLTL